MSVTSVWRRGTPSLASTAATSTSPRTGLSLTTVRVQRSRQCRSHQDHVAVTAAPGGKTGRARPAGDPSGVHDGAGELRVVEVRVGPAGRQQFVVGALLDD